MYYYYYYILHSVTHRRVRVPAQQGGRTQRRRKTVCLRDGVVQPCLQRNQHNGKSIAFVFIFFFSVTIIVVKEIHMYISIDVHTRLRRFGETRLDQDAMAATNFRNSGRLFLERDLQFSWNYWDRARNRAPPDGIPVSRPAAPAPRRSTRNHPPPPPAAPPRRRRRRLRFRPNQRT